MEDYTAGKIWKIERKQRIIEAGFRLFADRGIEQVTLPEIARAGNVGHATLTRYFRTRLDLVVAIGVCTWENYINWHNDSVSEKKLEQMTGAEYLTFFMDAFMDLYRNHKDLLRFNYNFNSYLQHEACAEQQKQPLFEMVQKLEIQFHEIYERGMKDGTLNPEVTEPAMFSSCFHIMLAAVTRYAVGLAYVSQERADTEEELIMLEQLLLSSYVRKTPAEPQKMSI